MATRPQCKIFLLQQRAYPIGGECRLVCGSPIPGSISGTGEKNHFRRIRSLRHCLKQCRRCVVYQSGVRHCGCSFMGEFSYRQCRLYVPCRQKSRIFGRCRQYRTQQQCWRHYAGILLRICKRFSPSVASGAWSGFIDITTAVNDGQAVVVDTPGEWNLYVTAVAEVNTSNMAISPPVSINLPRAVHSEFASDHTVSINVIADTASFRLEAATVKGHPAPSVAYYMGSMSPVLVGMPHGRKRSGKRTAIPLYRLEKIRIPCTAHSTSWPWLPINGPPN